VASFLTPPLGDIRSRLIRLIPDAPEGSAENAIHGLLAHRFPSHYSETEAKNEWRDILEGHSSLWDNIPGDRKVGHSGAIGRPPKVDNQVNVRKRYEVSIRLTSAMHV
jgi:hypothetical protein